MCLPPQKTLQLCIVYCTVWVSGIRRVMQFGAALSRIALWQHSRSQSDNAGMARLFISSHHSDLRTWRR